MTGSRSSLPRLFAELKRRKVFRVMAAYGIIGFGIIEAAEAIFPRVALPDWTVTFVVWLTLLGFPIAVILTWAFDSTPEGVKRTADATEEEISEIIAQPASKRWMPGLLALAGVALLFGGWWMGRQGTGPDRDLGVQGVQAAEFRRVAVLPFESLGGNEEDDPFLAGMHEDIHGKLMNLADLRVTALRSAQEFAASELPDSEIAAELHVDYLLRGSVRRAGALARVNVRLTDVAAGEDIWFNQYDKEVNPTNLFDIQSEIARSVADALEATLSPQDLVQLDAGLSTTNPEAINAYYQARSAWGNTAMRTLDDITVPAGLAEPLIERAIELAPDFVEAWALGAEVWSTLSRYGTDARTRAFEAVERVERLAPKSLPATTARAWYEFSVSQDLTRALSQFQSAASMAPSNVNVLTVIGELQYRLGDFAEGSQTMRRAVFLDPRSAEAHANLSRMLRNRSMWDAATAVVDRGLAIDPRNEPALRQKVWLIIQGDVDPRRALELLLSSGLEPRFEGAFAAWVARDYDAAAEFLRRSIGAAGAAGTLQDYAANLLWLALVEEARGGDVGTVRDSIAALLRRESAQGASVMGRRTRGTALLRVGREEEGWAALEESLSDARSSQDEAVLVTMLWSMARSYAQFGRTEEALALLDEAVGRPASDVWSMADLELEPRFDIIRDDPRFADLLARQQAYEDEQARIAIEEGPWLP